MSELNCESVSMAAMAIADGYQPELSSEQIGTHLASCADCRREVGQLQELSSLLGTQDDERPQNRRGARTSGIHQSAFDRLPEILLPQPPRLRVK